MIFRRKTEDRLFRVLAKTFERDYGKTFTERSCHVLSVSTHVRPGEGTYVTVEAVIAE